MDRGDVRLAVVFKDFAAWLKVSCVGLHVAGYNVASVLRNHGVHTVVFPVRHNVDIVNAIDKYNETHTERLTHVVISAPWVSTWDLKALIEHFTDINFVVVCHSNVGFLMADACGVELLRQGVELAKSHSNLTIGGNSNKFVKWMREAYGEDVVLLPNLYPLEGRLVKPRTQWEDKNLIKIGSFGAVRHYKNHITAAAAALLISRRLRVPVEFHMSSGGEGGILRSIEEMCSNVPGFKLVYHSWSYWDDFVKVVGDMDLLMQVSFTESFNLITADGVYMGIPTVVSTAINWAPDAWRADSDDALDVAKKGIELLFSGRNDDGVVAIERHNKKSVKDWLSYLEGKRIGLERVGFVRHTYRRIIAWFSKFNCRGAM